MKHSIKKISTVAISLMAYLSLPVYANSQTQSDPLHQEAQAIAKQFLGQLKPELQKSMKTNGPAKTIDFCHTKAPEIAKKLAQKTGWNINRVSLKPRGLKAQPDQWETSILKRFNEQLSQGTPPQKMEFSAIVTIDNQKQFRYMKAIPTGDVCLTCHGANITPPVQKALQNHYPNDAATGYTKGQIRGAFSFSKAL